MRRLAIVIGVLVSACTHRSGASEPRPPGDASWTYPEIVNTWQRDGFPVCATGTNQSPIDLGSVPPPPPVDAAVTVPALRFAPGESGTDPHNFSFHLPRGAAPEYIVVDGTRWEVTEFHFHTPAENALPGAAAPMELHVKTVLATDAHVYAVFAVLLDERAGDDGAWLAPIFDLLAGRKPGPFSLGAPGPLGAFTRTAFFGFPGSLTTPPCSPVPHWFVLGERFPIGVGQAARFSALLAAKFRTPNNARGLQPVGDRPIQSMVPRP